MRIAFVGDIHGRVLHLLALLLELQRTGRAIDRVIQVGDFGAYRLSGLVHPARKDPTRRIQAGAVAIFDSVAGTLVPLSDADMPQGHTGPGTRVTADAKV